MKDKKIEPPGHITTGNVLDDLGITEEQCRAAAKKKFRKLECNEFLIKMFGSQEDIDSKYSGTILGLEEAFKANEPHIAWLEAENKQLMDLFLDCMDDLGLCNKEQDNMKLKDFIITRLDYYHKRVVEIINSEWNNVDENR